MTTKRWVRALGVVVATTVLLAACGGAGAGDDTAAPDFAEITILPLLSGEAIVSLSGGDSFASTIGLSGYNGAILAQAWLMIAVAGWSEDAPQTYTFGEYTISWTRLGSTWCWDIYDGPIPGAGSFWYSVCITDTGSGWDLEVRDGIGDAMLVEGNLSYDGTSGNVTYYYDDGERFEIGWGSGGSWDYSVTATYYLTGANQGYLVLSFNDSDGVAAEGVWALYEPGGTLLENGSWPPS